MGEVDDEDELDEYEEEGADETEIHPYVGCISWQKDISKTRKILILNESKQNVDSWPNWTLRRNLLPNEAPSDDSGM